MTVTVAKSLFLGRLYDIISLNYCEHSSMAPDGHVDEVYRDVFGEYRDILNDPNVPGDTPITIRIPNKDELTCSILVNMLAEAACLKLNWVD